MSIILFVVVAVLTALMGEVIRRILKHLVK